MAAALLFISQLCSYSWNLDAATRWDRLPGKLCSLRVLARNVLPSMTTFSQGPGEMSLAAFSSWRRGGGSGTSPDE